MFRSREQLIQHIQKCNLRRCIQRALDDPMGKVELLGGFRSIPPGDYPGFIVDVTSKHKQTWHVAVVIKNWTAIVRVIDKVPWHLWVGDNSKTELYIGDNPIDYSTKKITHRS